MRTRRWLSACVAAAAIIVIATTGANAQEPSVTAIDEAGWQGVLGFRGTVSTAQRYVVLLDGPSVAERAREEGGQVAEAKMRAWTASAVGLQEQFLARMAASGARVAAEYRYVRVINGFAARLDPTSLAMLEGDREVAGVYPVRVAYPAQSDELDDVTPAAVAGVSVPGIDGTGVTVALLDTGVDASHPYLRGSVVGGIDLINPGSGAIAQPHPTISGRPERHATELAGIITGSDGPGGLHGVAPGATIFPLRVGGWQPDAEGGYTVYSRTDQILAGLEAAVDPNEDGDTLDAARIALIGFVEPYASFPEGPLARAVAGATALDMLVVVPAGNDGRAGPSFGSVAGPGGAEDALTVAAADSRLAAPTVRVHVRGGLRVLFEGPLPLGGAPTHTVAALTVPITRGQAARGIAGFFDADGVSAVAGRAALLPAGLLSEETIEEATTAGAVSVLVDGRLPAGAYSLDVPTGVPVVGLPAPLVEEVRTMLAAGVPVTVAVGAVDVVENAAGGAVAAFSSRGLALGGGLKPDLVAAGVAVPTSEPGRGEEGEVRFGTVSGTSVSAAVVAGTAAVLAQGRPRVGAAGLKSLLTGSAQRRDFDLDALSSGAGLVDVRAAVQQEIVTNPVSLSFGVPLRRSLELERTLRVRNASTRPLEISIQSAALASRGVEISIDPERLQLPPGRSADVVVRADTTVLSDQAGAATGELVLVVTGSSEVHVPWAVAVPSPETDLLTGVSLEPTAGRVSDATPAVLELVAGALTTTPGLEVRPVDVLEVQLRRGGELLGVLARRREVLPGRYTFGLTGRGPDGDRLSRGTYMVRVVARPGSGLRQQVEDVRYQVR
jgi:minor extracellular serine protease Vpr